jgi:hypothetical protein
MEDTKGAFAFTVRQAAMGNLHPDMAPGRTSQALLWCDYVCEGASIMTWEPLPPPDGLGWGPCGDAIPD